MADSQMPIADRLAADVFRQSYRGYHSLKPTHYKWSHLAPQSIVHLGQAVERHWSDEMLGDYLHCDSQEAAECRKRYLMSKRINAPEDSAGRLRQAVFEWIGGLAGIAEMDEATRKSLAKELARMVGNQLYLAAQAREDLMELSQKLTDEEEPPADTPKRGNAPDAQGPWGPQWKD